MDVCTTEVLLDFLPIVDNLERALAAGSDDDAVVRGVELVHKQFIDQLARYGVERIHVRPMDRFNPMLHEAVSVERVGSPALDGLVTGVVRAGYTMGDRLLRPARVSVAKTSQLRSA